MIRIPLRPLATILKARKTGKNPDDIERANIRQRHEDMQDESRMRAEGRLLVLGMLFFLGFLSISARMAFLAASEPSEPKVHSFGGAIHAQRADIVDRQGRILATNMETTALYAHPQELIDPKNAVKQLVRIFPDLDEQRLLRDFSGPRKFVWVKKKVSPEQKQAVYDIGDPGLLLGPREMRLYPNGRLAAHVLGGARFGREGVHAAEVLGVAGVEFTFDEYLRDVVNYDVPLQLSLDLSVQAEMEQLLAGGIPVRLSRWPLCRILIQITDPLAVVKIRTTRCSTALYKAFMNWGQRLKYLRLRKRWNWVWSIQILCSTFAGQFGLAVSASETAIIWAKSFRCRILS